MRKRYTPEQIIGVIWEPEVRLAQGWGGRWAQFAVAWALLSKPLSLAPRVRWFKGRAGQTTQGPGAREYLAETGGV